MLAMMSSRPGAAGAVTGTQKTPGKARRCASIQNLAVRVEDDPANARDQEIDMGKLVVSEFITLDGVIENPGGSEDSPHGGWSFRHPAPEGQQFKFDELRASDVQLLGRVTYEGFAAAWPAMEESTGEFGKKMNAMPKVVVSSTLTDPAWSNTTVVPGNLAVEVGRRPPASGSCAG
jgi:dihydrofolate reductase